MNTKTKDIDAKIRYDNTKIILGKIKKQALEFGFSEISDVILNDKRFPIWSGSSRPEVHHYGDGGLIKHVSEVIDLCLMTNEYYGKSVDSGLLFLAALFHDAGKMWDYAKIDGILKKPDDNGQWGATDHKYKIHHICRSALVWQEAYVKFPFGLKQEYFDEILHAILSHHGRREWGSPIEPQTKMAWILHLCDGISARMDDCGKGKK